MLWAQRLSEVVRLGLKGRGDTKMSLRQLRVARAGVKHSVALSRDVVPRVRRGVTAALLTAGGDSAPAHGGWGERPPTLKSGAVSAQRLSQISRALGVKRSTAAFAKSTRGQSAARGQTPNATVDVGRNKAQTELGAVVTMAVGARLATVVGDAPRPKSAIGTATSTGASQGGLLMRGARLGGAPAGCGVPRSLPASLSGTNQLRTRQADRGIFLSQPTAQRLTTHGLAPTRRERGAWQRMALSTGHGADAPVMQTHIGPTVAERNDRFTSGRGSPSARSMVRGQAAATDPRELTSATDQNGADAAGSQGVHGDVYLDGALMGRWLARTLAEQAGRPASSGPGFDPTRSPFPAGRMIGF
jgi:hypothetical protein